MSTRFFCADIFSFAISANHVPPDALHRHVLEEQVEFAPQPRGGEGGQFGIGRVHRYPLAELKCVSPKRHKQIATRIVAPWSSAIGELRRTALFPLALRYLTS